MAGRGWVLALLSVLLLSCAPTGEGFRTSEVPQQASATRPAPPSHRPTPMAGDVEAAPLYQRPVTQIYRGTGSFVAEPFSLAQAVEAQVGDEGITLNFVNADIRDVVQAVLGDYLQLNYVLDPNVQGYVTTQTSRPMPPDAVLPVLEQALNMNGVALVRAGDLYRVVPLGEATRSGSLSVADVHRAASQPGFGVEIMPLRYVGAAEMARLLEPVAPSGALLTVDAARNLLVVGGTERERQLVAGNIALFDVDWLAGMSFGLFSPRHVPAELLRRELEEVVGGEDGPLAGLVRLIAIDRLNAVLAISPQPRYLEALQTWVQRLDQAGETLDRRFFVYHVQNGRAKDLADVLTRTLGRGDAAAPAPSSGEDPSMLASVRTRLAAAGGEPRAQGWLSRQPFQEIDVDTAAGPVFDGRNTGSSGLATAGLGRIDITADEVNNALVIMATPREYEIIEAALRQLDTVPLQVLLEAAIAEVTLTNDLRYGVQYFFQRGNSQAILSSARTAQIAPTFPGLGLIFSPSSNIRIILDALSGVTNVNVISSPEVLVLNNQTATLQVGDQVPVATQQAVSVTDPDAPIVNAIEFRDTGVILTVTPRVNRGGLVQLDITQEVSDVVPTTTSSLNSPTIQQRRIASTVAVHDGETIALGGLIRDGRTNSRSGVPVLMDIPLVGNLFSTTEQMTQRTELLVLITPRVVDSLEKARSVTEELREKLRATHIFFRQ